MINNRWLITVILSIDISWVIRMGHWSINPLIVIYSGEDYEWISNTNINIKWRIYDNYHQSISNGIKWVIDSDPDRSSISDGSPHRYVCELASKSFTSQYQYLLFFGGLSLYFTLFRSHLHWKCFCDTDYSRGIQPFWPQLIYIYMYVYIYVCMYIYM